MNEHCENGQICGEEGRIHTDAACYKKGYERLLGVLYSLAGGYIECCSGCDEPTWWRTEGVPICLRCAMRLGRQATHAVPPALRQFLPPCPQDSPPATAAK